MQRVGPEKASVLYPVDFAWGTVIVGDTSTRLPAAAAAFDPGPATASALATLAVPEVPRPLARVDERAPFVVRPLPRRQVGQVHGAVAVLVLQDAVFKHCLTPEAIAKLR